MHVSAESATVFRTEGRRYLTRRAAYMKAAYVLMKRKCDCTPYEKDTGAGGSQCVYCDPHRDGHEQLRNRLARWLRRRDLASPTEANG